MRSAAALLLACGGVAADRLVGLRDTPIGASAVRYLDGETWLASTESFTIPARVPGDQITDLQLAGLIGDPLYELNWRNSTTWAGKTWSYSTTFAVPVADAHAITLLVFDGVKMGATVHLNGRFLSRLTNQFLRYELPVSLRPGSNTLTVTFEKHDWWTGGRFMACSGGWDWGPYSNTFTGEGGGIGDHTMTKGIWKSVYLARVCDVAIKHAAIFTEYLGSYPTAPLAAGAHGDFNVSVTAHLWAPGRTDGELVVTPSWGQAVSAGCTANGDSSCTLTLTASASDIKLWWPLGGGQQPLFGVNVSFRSGSSELARVQRRVGFRTVALVTGNDTDPTWRAKAATSDGSAGLGMMLRVNGQPIVARGANVIPMDNFEGRYTGAAHTQMVRSAAASNMNMLRIWGGGIFLPEAFYDACDELGVLVYHDLMYTTTSKTHEPHGTVAEDLEIRHNVRRLSHRPSIVIWNACNECSKVGLYSSFAMTIVGEEDRSRPVWPGSPSSGWKSGVRMLDGFANGNPLEPMAGTSHPLEIHGPYANGNGWSAVNQAPVTMEGKPKLLVRPSNLPTDFSKPWAGSQQSGCGCCSDCKIGTARQNTFGAEFGVSAMSSFESMSPTLAPEHWAVHGGQGQDDCTATDPVNSFWRKCSGGNVMAQRNYPCDNLIFTYFGKDVDLDSVGATHLQRQLYQCMVGQALALQADIEMRRSANTFGMLFWQLNEVWPTGGWGTLEYGTPSSPGQVEGGRWKPAQHLLASSLYRDVFATCGAGGWCYVRNDGAESVNGSLSLKAVVLATGAAQEVFFGAVSLAAGPAIQWFRVEGWGNYTAGDHVFTCSLVRDTGSALITDHVILPLVPANLTIQKTNVSSSPAAQSGVPVAVVKNTGSSVAVYVTLTSTVQGRFLENFFLLPPGSSRNVIFVAFANVTEKEWMSSFIRVDHLGMYA